MEWYLLIFFVLGLLAGGLVGFVLGYHAGKEVTNTAN